MLHKFWYALAKQNLCYIQIQKILGEKIDKECPWLVKTGPDFQLLK